MKRYLLLLIMGLSLTSFSQQLQLTPSFGASTYYRIFPDEYYGNPNDFKLTTNAGFTYIHHLEKISFSIGVDITNYAGKHLDGSYGMSHYYKSEGDFSNKTIGFNFSLIDKMFNDKLEMNYGFSINYRTASSRTGYVSWATIGGDAHYSNLDSEGGKKTLTFLTYGISYPIAISEQMAIVPQYQMAIGITQEYNDYRRWSNYLGCGLRYQF